MEFKNLVIGHHANAAISVNINSIPNGLYFLIGANGSGKSTFLKTVFGEIKAISGSIELANQSSGDKINLLERAQQISFLSTGIQHVDYLTVENYIHLGSTPFMNRFGKLKEEIKSPADDFINLFDLKRHTSRYLDELSDGEKQLVGIAKTIHQDTSILLMDEPTSFLDPKNKRSLFAYLKQFAETKDKTIIISTHDIEVALPYASGLLMINKKSMSLESNMDLQNVLSIY